MDQTYYRRYRRIIAPAFKSKKTKAYGMLILSLLTASFFIVFAIRPTITTIAKLRKETQDNQYVEEKLSEKINTLTILDQIYKKIEGDLNSVEAVIPSQPNFENLLPIIEDTAVKHQLGILSLQFKPVDLLKPRPEQSNFQANPVAFQVTLTGNYQNLISGLTSLSDASRLITIDVLKIRKARGAGEEELVLEAEGRSFYVN